MIAFILDFLFAYFAAKLKTHPVIKVTILFFGGVSVSIVTAQLTGLLTEGYSSGYLFIASFFGTLANTTLIIISYLFFVRQGVEQKKDVAANNLAKINPNWRLWFWFFMPIFLIAVLFLAYAKILK